MCWLKIPGYAGVMPPSRDGNFSLQGVPSARITGQTYQPFAPWALQDGLNPSADDVGDDAGAEDLCVSSKPSLEGEGGVLGGEGVESRDDSSVSSSVSGQTGFASDF